MKIYEHAMRCVGRRGAIEALRFNEEVNGVVSSKIVAIKSMCRYCIEESKNMYKRMMNRSIDQGKQLQRQRE